MADHLGELRQRGARVAVDDVSTGYAGLLRLAGLRPHILKIDRSAVTAVTGSTERVAVIEALVSMGRRLGCLLLAEGVESDEDLAALSSLDVDLVQGWAIAPPAAGLEPISPRDRRRLPGGPPRVVVGHPGRAAAARGRR